MVWKMLTAISQIESMKQTVLTLTTVQRLEHETSVQRGITIGQQLQQVPALRFVNVQRLLLMERALDSMKMLPYITPRETLPPIRGALITLPEEEEYYTKRLITKQALEEEETTRPEILRTELQLERVKERPLHPTAITLTDHEDFCLMEKWLKQHVPIQLEQVLDKLILMTIAKTPYCETITGLEALIKQMLQLYIGMFMGHPEQTNMIALRVTALTRQRLQTKPVAVYMSATHQAQASKPKALLTSTQKRKLETKAVSSGKPRTERVPRKEELDTMEEYDDNTKIDLMKDMYGKAMFSIAMRYAYGMPYFIRRWLARTYGLPENHKYIRYLKMMGIPVRLALWAWRRKRYTGDDWTYFKRDEYLKLMQKYGSRYRAGYPRY